MVCGDNEVSSYDGHLFADKKRFVCVLCEGALIEHMLDTGRIGLDEANYIVTQKYPFLKDAGKRD